MNNKNNVHVFAHRGGRKWAPENTLSAFGKSVNLGVFGIELDVQRCKTGELVVLHDENLERTTDGKGRVGDTSLEDLRKISAGSLFAPGFAAERVPLLSEVLSLVDGKVVLNIEIKNQPTSYPAIEDDLIALLAGYGHDDKIVISSFDHDVLLRLSKKAPQYKTAILVNGLLVDLPQYATKLGAKVWHPMFNNLRDDNVRSARQAGLEVNVWTLNSKDEWAAALRMGVDGIVTDDPEGLVQYLSSLP
jgi:glycerophosphoryl diester phosphodiesterase